MRLSDIELFLPLVDFEVMVEYRNEQSRIVRVRGTLLAPSTRRNEIQMIIVRTDPYTIWRVWMGIPFDAIVEVHPIQ